MFEVWESLLQIRPGAPFAREDLSDRSAMHKTLSKAFCTPGAPTEQSAEELRQARVLFRIAQSTSRVRPRLVFVRSQTRPDWSLLTVAEGYLAGPPEVHHVPISFEAGSHLAFDVELVLGEGPNHTPIRDEKTFADRLYLLFADRGAHVMEVDLRRFLWGSSSRVMRGRTYPAFAAQGWLEVEEPANFADAYAMGIGRNKAHGFGMLLLPKPSEFAELARPEDDGD